MEVDRENNMMTEKVGFAITGMQGPKFLTMIFSDGSRIDLARLSPDGREIEITTQEVAENTAIKLLDRLLAALGHYGEQTAKEVAGK